MTSVADFIMTAYVAQGGKHCFTVPGGHCQYLLEAADFHGGIEVIHCHHEQVAAVAAAGYYHASKRAALVICTAGPGVMNALSGVAAAWLDRTPMMVVSGQIKRDDLGQTERPSFVPLLPTVTIVKPFTAYATLVTSASEIEDRVARAFASIHNGPVWIDVPLDVQCSEL